MIRLVGSTVRDGRKMTFGTHNGIFHCDEVVGIAILELAYIESDTFVVRTRDCEELKKLNIVIDVGGGEYDHHMAGFNECRSTGEKYASAGLVWRKYASQAIRSVAEMEDIKLSDEEVQIIKEQIDQEYIVPVDLEDNGEKVSTHTFSFVSKFLPSWMEIPIYDCAFKRAESTVFAILKEIIRDKAVQIVTKKELRKRYAKVKEGILEIPAQTMPWLENVVEYNEENENQIKFVIFPYPAGGWAAQCVPPSIERKFEQLVPFPKEWAGGNEKTLPKLSAIKNATFCHNGCFFARAETKQAIVKMCKIAMS
jgi:uncharacterized UPF0160 family protein